MRTRVRSRFGLVQGMCRVPGFERVARPGRPDGRRRARSWPSTAASSSRSAVTTRLLPGPDRGPRPGLPRLDGRLQGVLRARSVAYHRGFGTFGPGAGARALRPLAIRNSFLFAWKNLAGIAAGRAPLLAARPAGLLAAARDGSIWRSSLFCRVAAAGARSRPAWQCTGGRAGIADRAAGGVLSQVSSGSRRTELAAPRCEGVARGRRICSRVRNPQGGDRCLSPALHLVIDARPRGPRGPLAAEVVLGRPVLSHLLEQARRWRSPGRPIAVHAREDEHALLRGLVGRPRLGPGRVRHGAAPGGSRDPADRPASTTAAGSAGPFAAGADPETAVIWRLDRAELAGGGRGGADAAADLSAAGPVLGLRPRREAGRRRSSPRAFAPTAHARRGRTHARRGRHRRRSAARDLALRSRPRWPWPRPSCSTRPTAAWPGSRGRPRPSAAGSTRCSTSSATWPSTRRSPGRSSSRRPAGLAGRGDALRVGQVPVRDPVARRRGA